MGRFRRYLLARLLFVLPTLLGVSLLAFGLIHLIPGDPARLIAGDDATDETIRDIQAAYGLDRPLHIQYLIYLGNLARGQLGVSIRSGRPILEEIAPRFLNTLQLALAAILLTVAAGIPLGVLAASRRRTALDRLSMLAALCGIATPVFWLGILFQIVFAVWLQWLPSGGTGGLRYLLLPAFTLAAFSVANVARLTRASLLEILGQDFIRTARAKGLTEPAILFGHALRNALIPTLTFLSLQFGFLLGGAVLTETVFSYSGIGRYLVQSIFFRDYPVVQGVILIIACSYILVNLVADLLYSWADPRISY
ncbi:MAG: ABC transporter permease [Deltaproteobacteria bacterium]|nr:ABC transporter permease [Deltaproteobacteria bacterium]MBI3075693.1 ABC transporter permease [Deltaproteobacteria bacterium]